MRAPTDADRIVWLAARQAPKAISHWTPDDKAQLHALVGKALPSEIARRLGRAEKQVKAKLNQLGYSIPGDALAPIGISSKGLARRISAGYFTVLDAILSRRLKARKNGKDYFVYWKDARAFERQYRHFQQKRAGTLARIGERTISAGQFARLVGLSDTQSRRYLQGRIVRVWRVPLDPAHVEWRVSLADAKARQEDARGRTFQTAAGEKGVSQHRRARKSIACGWRGERGRAMTCRARGRLLQVATPSHRSPATSGCPKHRSTIISPSDGWRSNESECSARRASASNPKPCPPISNGAGKKQSQPGPSTRAVLRSSASARRACSHLPRPRVDTGSKPICSAAPFIAAACPTAGSPE
jgi:hypothetical protein